MPRSKVKTTPVNKKIFCRILKEKGSSIRKLGDLDCIDCSEKTIRRELNNGGIREQYLDQIARYLNVDSRLLSGELVKRAYDTEDVFWKEIYLRPLEHIIDYPYFREEQERRHRENMDETLKRILSLFEVSYDQFIAKDFEDQYEFQHDLFSAMMPVMYKHFDRDGYGDTQRTSFESIIAQLESYRDDYNEKHYADTTLRERFLKEPPEGYSCKQIQRMSPSELIELDLSIQWPEYEDRFSESDELE